MDISRFKEESVNILNSLRDRLVSSPVFHLLKEKYDHLSAPRRKALQSAGLLILTCLLLYYPASRLYSSWKNMRDFNTKKKLVQELMTSAPSANTASRAKAYTAGQDPAGFIRRRIPVLQIPKNQVKEIKNLKEKASQAKSLLSFPAQIKKVQMDISGLNLREIVKYGQRLENLSKNIKLTGLKIHETPEKDNYFNVSYILSFFSLEHGRAENKKTNVKEDPTHEKKETKRTKKFFMGLKKPKTAPMAKEPLWKLKNIKDKAHFEKPVAKDLLPAQPAPESPKAQSEKAPPPPPLPDKAKNTIKEKKGKEIEKIPGQNL